MKSSYRVDLLRVSLQHLFGGADEAAVDAVEGPGVLADPAHVLVSDVGRGRNPVHPDSGRLGHLRRSYRAHPTVAKGL